MIILKKSLHRRTFLRGAGVTLALPLLDAMVPALSALSQSAGEPIRRLGFVYVPNGVNVAKWSPTGETGALALSPTLQPLEKFRDSVVAFSRLACVPGEAFGDGAGDHARATASWLSGVHCKKTQGADVRAGKTIDQLAADQIGKDTQFPSLQFAVDDISVAGGCDGGYTCTYQNTLSWRTPTTPLPMENNPRVAFERMFGGWGSGEKREQNIRAEKSVLDSVTKEAARLQSRLVAIDRARMEAYLDGIRELERRIAKVEHQADVALVSGEVPIGIPDLVDEHIKIMFDLQVLAYQADLTRVTTFLTAREVSQRTFVNIGVPDAHHGLSHHGDAADKLEKLAKIDKYNVELLAYFLEKLRSTPEGNGNLLDHSIIMYGSGISNGNNHSHRNLPTVIAGGGAGRIKGGRHIAAPEDTPQSNLLVSLLEKVGVNTDLIGDATGRMSEL